MKPRRYTDSELSRLQAIIGSDQPIRLVAHVSSGPWYGFKGVQALVLTEQALFRVQASKYALRPDAVLDKYLPSDVSDVHWTARGSDAGRIFLRLAGARKSYASKWAEASDLAAALTC